MNSTSPFSPDAIKADWKAQIIGKRIHVFDQLESTNSEAYRIAEEGGEEGEVVVADRQLRGKGRLGRSWHSPPGVNLYVSMILRPPIEVRKAPLLALMAAVAAVKAVKCVSGIQPRIKWPNDLLVNGRKLGGLLSEMKDRAGQVDFVILGIGINVNMTSGTIPEEMRFIATSLREELGYEISRVELLHALLRAVEGEYGVFLTGKTEGILHQWKTFSQMVGTLVEVRSFDEVIRGRVKGIDSDGSLLLLAADGSERSIVAGDVSHVRNLLQQ
jgi:BirA family biotin operon repressor/biotin-[acetyl-CoA-carboxylase] ligase